MVIVPGPAFTRFAVPLMMPLEVKLVALSATVQVWFAPRVIGAEIAIEAGAPVSMLIPALATVGVSVRLPPTPGAMPIEVSGPLPTWLLKVRSRMLKAPSRVDASEAAVWVLVEKMTLLLRPGVPLALVPPMLVAKFEFIPLKPDQLVFADPPQ